MAYYRRRKTYGRRPYRKRTYNRTYRRRWTRRSRYNKRGQKVYLYKRLCGRFGTVSVGAVSDAFYGFEFRLDQVPNYTELTALYDQYKINAIKVHFLPEMTQNVSLAQLNNPVAYSRIFTALDYNDASAPTTIDQLREYQSCKYTSILKQHKRYFKPRIVDSSSVYNPGRPWLSCDNGASVPHFGLKVGIEPTGATGATEMLFFMEVKFYMSFKTVK